MRVVVDSNVLARAVYSVGGSAEETVRQLKNSPHALLVSAFILEELRRVLQYPRLRKLHGFDDQTIDRLVADLTIGTDVVEVADEQVVPVVASDPDDDHVIAAAVVGNADVICTWNRHFYQKEVIDYCRQRSIEIMKNGELLRLLRSSEHEQES